jgi:hypothetical protein
MTTPIRRVYIQERGRTVGDVDATDAMDALRYWLAQHERLNELDAAEALSFGAHVNGSHTARRATARVGFPVRTLVAVVHA